METEEIEKKLAEIQNNKGKLKTQKHDDDDANAYEYDENGKPMTKPDVKAE
jgi:hypothetical protein